MSVTNSPGGGGNVLSVKSQFAGAEKGHTLKQANNPVTEFSFSRCALYGLLSLTPDGHFNLGVCAA